MIHFQFLAFSPDLAEYSKLYDSVEKPVDDDDCCCVLEPCKATSDTSTMRTTTKHTDVTSKHRSRRLRRRHNTCQ